MTHPDPTPDDANRPQDVETEPQLAACRRDLARLQREFEGLSYAIGHDLRAPLRAVSGFLQALDEDCSALLPPPARGYLQRAIESAARTQLMTEALLQLAGIGRQELRLVATPLPTVIDDVRREWIQETAGREIEWRIGPLPTLVCDRELIHQLLRHLLSNAVKFTRREPRAVIEITLQAANPDPVIVVRDNGVGFDATRAESLFQPFHRLHSQQDFEGIGAGLALAERIVRRHGGRIWFESGEGKGTAFYFTLPRPASAS